MTCAVKDPNVETKEMEVDEWIAQSDPSKSSSDSGEAGPGPTTTANKRFSRVTVVHAHILCPAHNPALAEKKRQEAHQGMLTRLTSVPYGSPVSLKLVSGTWGSYLLSVDAEREVAWVTNDKGWVVDFVRFLTKEEELTRCGFLCDSVPFEVKWNQIVYIPPPAVLSPPPSPPASLSGASETKPRVRMVQDVSSARAGSETARATIAGSGHNAESAPEGLVSTKIPAESSDFETTSRSTPKHSLRLGSQVMLTPGLIGLLSENPLLRSSLKGLGLGG